MERTFEYDGRSYPLSSEVYWSYSNPKGKHSNYCYQVLVNRYFIGNLYRDEEGFWYPDNYTQDKNLPFSLQAHDYQAIGEMIEEERGNEV